MADSFIEQLICLFEDSEYVEKLLAPVLAEPSTTSESLTLPSEAGPTGLSTVMDAEEPILDEINDDDNTSPTERYVPDDDNEFNFEISLNLSANFIKSSEDIFKLLNSSILHGEYLTVSTIEELGQHLNIACTEFLQNLKTASVEHGRYFNSLNIYFKVTERAIKDFIDLTTSLTLKVRTKKVYYNINGDTNILMDEFKNLNEPESNETLHENCLKQYRLFRINLSASRNEFLMQSIDFERLLSDLLIDVKWLIDIQDQLVLSDAIKWKCLYLDFKIKARITHESKNDIVFSDGVKELPSQDIEITPFKTWNESINRHYELDENSKAQITQIAVQDSNLVSKDLDQIVLLSEIHLLIKYYKDCAENVYHEELKVIREDIGIRYKKAKQNQQLEPFDAFALGFSYNYAINNEFSALIGREEDHQKALPNYEVVKSLYNEICKVQEVTGIDNFFPQYRYLQYLIKKIKFDLKTDIKEHKLDNIEALVKEAKAIFRRYDKNIFWTQNTYNYVFYLPKTECSVSFVDSQEIISKIFVASSFVLPLGKDRYTLEYNQLGIELTNLERAVEVISLINDEQKTISEKNEELADDLKGKETKYIEILGIFGAVITFASAGFTTQLDLLKANSANSITRGMISIGIVLFIFLLLLIIVTRFPLEKLWKNTAKLGLRKFGVALLLGLVFCVTSVGISTLCYNYEMNSLTEEFDQKYNKMVEKLKSDSILLHRKFNVQAEQTKRENLKINQPQPANTKRTR